MPSKRLTIFSRLTRSVPSNVLLVRNKSASIFPLPSTRQSKTKSPEPVFATNEAHGIFGPGHNQFTKAADGVTDLVVYHARNYRDIPGDPLHDPNRHTRVQVLRWKADGSPDFGQPERETPAAVASAK